MKSVISRLAVAASLVFLSFAPMSASALNDVDNAGETRAECLQRCMTEYHNNAAACADSCYVCDFYLLFVCVAGHTDQTCYNFCIQAAKNTYLDCVRGCPAAP